MTVAVIGLGGMGGRIARRLLDTGHDVVVWNRSADRATPLLAAGAIPAATPAEAAAGADVLITMVTGPAALRAVTDGPDGIAASGGSPTVVEMSTVGPAEVARLAAALPAGTGLLDAPVLGSIGEAAAGTLTIFIGGPAALVERVEPVLSALGSIVHVGSQGAGAAAKLVANASLFGALGALGEALALARALGLDDEAAHRTLAATPLAAQAERRRAAIEAGEYPPRFPLSLARKDADLIAGVGADLRLAAAARSWLADAEAAGWGDRDYTAMLGAILRPMPAYDGLILDLDGVVWLSGEPIDGAAEAIARVRERGVRVVFLTNDPGGSRGEHAARLTRIGVPATADDVVTAASATARFLGSRAGSAGALVVGSAALREEIERAGLRLVDDPRRAELVVVGGHDGFDYGELRAAAMAVGGGAALYATGRDAAFPTADGPVPATGAILAAIETAANATAVVLGKPSPHAFEMAREVLAGRERVAMVGDHLEADIAGAKAAGLDAILVLTGSTTRADLDRSAIRPDYVLDSLAAFG